MITIQIHSILDYCIGATLLLAPYVFGFSGVYFAHDVFTVIGLAILGYSLLSDYRYSWVRAVPFSMHMTFDVVSGIFLVLAPWIYGYHELLTPFQSALHWIMGFGLMGVVTFSEREERKPRTVIRVPESRTIEQEKRPSTKKAA